LRKGNSKEKTSKKFRVGPGSFQPEENRMRSGTIRLGQSMVGGGTAERRNGVSEDRKKTDKKLSKRYKKICEEKRNPAARPADSFSKARLAGHILVKELESRGETGKGRTRTKGKGHVGRREVLKATASTSYQQGVVVRQGKEKKRCEERRAMKSGDQEENSEANQGKSLGRRVRVSSAAVS